MKSNLSKKTDTDLTEAVQAIFYKCDFSKDDFFLFEEAISLAD